MHEIFPLLQGGVTEVTDAHNRELLFEANEESIVKAQAFARGYLTRKKFKERKEYLTKQEPSVVKLQVSYQGCCNDYLNILLVLIV